MEIAILYICTGEYKIFWKDFYASAERYLLTSLQKHYFVFTDAEASQIEGADINPNIHVIPQEALSWPYSTMMRFHMFSRVIDRLEHFDYAFFFNANMLCVSDICPEEFLPTQEEGLLVVQHPGFFDKQPYELSYDRNPRTLAYIPYNCGEVYVCGGLNGGTTTAYIQLILELKYRVDQDLQVGVIPLWHDESYLNRYILEQNAYRLLSPAFCYHEGLALPFAPKAMVRIKENWIDTKAIKLPSKGLFEKIIGKKSIRWVLYCVDAVRHYGWDARQQSKSANSSGAR